MKPYDMPEVRLGDFVHYYAHEDAAPNIAIVTEVSSRSLKCWVIVPDYGGVEKFSVHHKDDVGLQEFPEWGRYGMWDFKPADPTIAILSEKLAVLEKKMAEIVGKKTK